MIRENGQKITEAEILASLMHHIMSDGIENHWEQIVQLQKSHWKSTHPNRPALTHDEVKKVCYRIRTQSKTWQELGNGETLTLDWKTKSGQRRRPGPRILQAVVR